MTRSDTDLSPISFPVHVARLPKTGLEVTIEANEEQRSALAKDHDLLEVRRLTATLMVAAWRKGGVRVTGRVRADVMRECVVTLEPIAGVIDEEVSAMFLPEGSRLTVPVYSAEGEILLDPEGDDSPELFSGETIDVGQLAEELFSLGIDPYPRKSGVVLDDDKAGDEKRGPLHDKLAALRSKL